MSGAKETKEIAVSLDKKNSLLEEYSGINISEIAKCFNDGDDSIGTDGVDFDNENYANKAIANVGKMKKIYDQASSNLSNNI